jgi:ADP-ribose pyrophosphatase YjhB (NUDIX family)
MELQVGVKAFLKNGEGRILVLKRSAKMYPKVTGSWDIVGGRIDAGMPLIVNLRREIKEETGLEMIGEPRLVAAQDILRTEGKHVVRLSYIGEIEGDPLIGEEHEEFGWFSLDELRQLGDLDIYTKELIDNGTISESVMEGI